MGNESIEAKDRAAIAALLATRSFEPYIMRGQMQLNYVGHTTDRIGNDDIQVRCILYKIESAGKSYDALFKIVDKKNRSNPSASLICLGNQGVPSFQLVRDIVTSPGLYFAHPELLSGDDFALYIDTYQRSKSGATQTWIFFTPTKSHAVKVYLTEDGSGGSNFKIQ